MEAARKIRAVTGAPFTAGLLAALTAAVEDYAVARGIELNYHTPFTVVVPTRMPGQYFNPKKLEVFVFVIVIIKYCQYFINNYFEIFIG